MEKRIIVVSNSNWLKGKKLGQLIEKYEKIVRFNNYEIEGYEKDVGVSTHILYQRCCDDIKIRPNSFEQVYLVQPTCPYLNAMKFVANQYKLVYKDKCSVLGPQFCDVVASQIGLNAPQWPSVGAVALYHLISLYGSLNVIGFDYGASGHYFKKQPVDAKNHDFAKEAHFFKNLVDSGKITEIW